MSLSRIAGRAVGALTPALCLAGWVAAQDDVAKPPRKASVEAPALSGITIDGDLKDWPLAMPRYAVRNLQVIPPHHSVADLEGADLSTSPDLSACFSVGYDPKEQVIYLGVIVCDDTLVLGHTSWLDTDVVEVYVDGLHSEVSKPFPQMVNMVENVDASYFPVLQYIGLPGDGPVYGVKKSSGQERGPDNPILMFGDIKKTKSRMAFRREGGVTTYEWALQAFDRYPDKPTRLTPFKKIGFDVVVVDKDKPAVSPQAMNEPERDQAVWVCWGPDWKNPKYVNAGHLGEIMLGPIPETGPPAREK
jgi:hypothetical protein